MVLANLLIALISYHFQPEKTEAQSKFQMAEILQHYEVTAARKALEGPRLSGRLPACRGRE